MALGATIAVLWQIMAGCTPEQPVISGIPEDPLLTPATEPGAPPAPYERAPGVWIDVRHFGGQPLDANRVDLAPQLGALQTTRELPADDGKELVFERATLRVLDGRIYMFSVPLPEPMRRTEALVTLGFPPQIDDYIVLHREYRVNHQWGFRRIRLMRQSRYNELVTRVEAWSWVPGEHSSHR